MKTEPLEFLPEARRKGIISKEVDGEMLVYDCARDKAHCLNSLAAAVWDRCDGQTSTKEIANSLAKENDRAVDEDVVWLALAELRRSHLLKEASMWPGQIKAMTRMSRREAVRRIGLGAAIALPIVISIAAPTPAQAGSCKHANANCATPVECCSGSCDTDTTHKCIGG